MADLYPTKTRLALLADVARHFVWTDGGDVYVAKGNGGRSKVTARAEDMALAGWVRLGGSPGPRRPLELTDAGRAVLDAHGGA